MKINRAILLSLTLCASCATGSSAPQKEPQLPEKYSGVTPLEWSQRMGDSEIARKGDALAWKPGGRAKWDYTAGLFTLSLLKLNELNPTPRYVAFATNAIGSFISNDGKLETYNLSEYQLDALNPGKTVLALAQLTKEPRYAVCATMLRQQLNAQPRTPDGGFWHKQRYTNQMWLDGIFMGDAFYAQFAATKLASTPANDFDDIAKQIRLVDEHTYDAASGLNYHGWDAMNTQPWVNHATSCSSNFWGRAEGWYAMALVDILDYFPTNHLARKQIIATLQKTARGIVKWQDRQSGLWWQVMDQGNRKGNYREATASAMFVYALAKGVNHGYLSRDYIPAIQKGYAGIIQNLIKPDGENRWSLTQCCSVAGLGGSPSNGQMRDGSFNYYIGEPVVNNDLKGIGPFILAGIELTKLAEPVPQPGK